MSHDDTPRGRKINRRAFVKTSSGLFVAAGTLASCGDDPTAGAMNGTLRIVVSGLSGSEADGGSVTGMLVGGVEQITVPVPTSGTLDAQIRAGVYLVTYSPPIGAAVGPGVANPVNVTVPAGGLVIATFTVVAVTGLVTVTVTGISAGSPNGGNAQVERIDVTSTPVQLPIPTAGSASTSVAPGTYRVTYTSPSGHSINAGVVNPLQMVVSANATSSFPFAVTVSPVGTAPDIYEHGFENATGGSFTNGIGQSMLAPTGVWSIDAADAARGSSSARTTVQPSAGNISALIHFPLPAAAAKRFYVRFAMKQDLNYSNNDDQKINRAQGSINGNWGSFLIRGGTSAFWYFWDDFAPVVLDPNRNLPAPTANSLRGSWHWYEVFRDVTDMNNLRCQVWIDNVLYFDHTLAASNPQPTLAYNRTQWWGTINSLSSVSTIWMDHIGISTQKMGIP